MFFFFLLEIYNKYGLLIHKHYYIFELLHHNILRNLQPEPTLVCHKKVKLYIN